MTANKLCSLPSFLVCFILSANLVLAVLQNVTVDDAVQIDPVVPVYFPAPSDWNQGGQCPGCAAQPDPSYAYNGTWHDATFNPIPGNIYQSFQITFVGSGLYIFFIFANNLGTSTTTFTNVEFILDDVVVSTYTHNPTSSASYDYNQTVYANNSIPYGEHSMLVAPVKDSDSVLILFDYFIYTTDVNGSATTSSTVSSATSSAIVAVSSGPNVGAIAGGTIAGVSVLLSVAISVICYRRRKLRRVSPTSNMSVIEPFDLSPPTAATSPVSSSPIQRMLMEFPSVLPGQGHKANVSVSSTGAQASDPSSAPTHSSLSNTSRSRDNADLLEQVGMLRNEVARLRRAQDQGWNGSDFGSETPPEYS